MGRSSVATSHSLSLLYCLNKHRHTHRHNTSTLIIPRVSLSEPTNPEKMRFSSIIAPVSLLGLASALPSVGKRGDKCIPYSTAQELVNDWVATLTTPTDTANMQNLLAPSFTDYSDSINFIAGIPLGSVTFPSPQAYIAGQGAQPPIGLTILNLDAVTCDGVIAVRWVATVGAQIDEAKGISILHAVQSGSDCNAVGPAGGSWVNCSPSSTLPHGSSILAALAFLLQLRLKASSGHERIDP